MKKTKSASDEKQNAPEEKLPRRSDVLLDAIAQSAVRLLEAPDWKTEINDLLKLLGEATHASHAYLFENHLDENGNLVTSQKYEWTGPGQTSELDNPDFQNVPVLEEGLAAWYSVVSQGKPFYNTTKIFEEVWQDTPSRQDIKTLLDVPIFVDGKWWGVIGFDDCIREMAWTKAEVHAMQVTASMLGSAIKRQKIDTALRASEEKFQTTFHHTFVPMVIGRLSDKSIVDINEAFSQEIGFSREEAINHKASDLNLWADPDEHNKHHQLLQEQGFIREFKARYRRKSGEAGVALLSVAPITVNNEACVLYTLYDITKIDELLIELQNKNNELESFTYTVSHDLKAPLITIGGFVGYLEKDILNGNTAKAQKDIQRVMDAVIKMQRLLNELLELSRIGRFVNKPENANIGDIAREASRLLHEQVTSNKVKVIIEKDLPSMEVDRHRLVEVYQNLIDNAIKFMGNRSNPEVKVGSFQQENEQIFFVKDNGIGIDPLYHERIFGLFNKLDAGTDGTGIGLALVKRIIEFHGGRVWVESESGKGTTFCFTLTART
ncbi:MAG TPA: ATP-binding protein [Anaerolineales bacterium]|nr:ATP-binding protein [Anaerolineales bacterium]HMV97129.1 ATP-binding protein [Anaerolineales bacterium]HMX73410.1 ATP-binding protein [Anaerolineales bacterium]HMZ42052.1 ATP-binding protein [Anaerolineales bacterium]HNA53509.1 ATP-binding protein [Anaerolineales bacterium]